MSLENYTPEQLQELALLSKTLAENKDTRKDFLKMTKKVRPDLPIPELEMEETASKLAETYETKIAAMEARLAEKDAKDTLEKRRQSLLESGKASSKEEIAEIEKVMIEKKIHDHDAAADYWKWMQQTATPTPSAFPKPVMQQFDVSGYMKNPVVAARDEAMKAFQELRKNPRPIGL